MSEIVIKFSTEKIKYIIDNFITVLLSSMILSLCIWFLYSLITSSILLFTKTISNGFGSLDCFTLSLYSICFIFGLIALHINKIIHIKFLISPDPDYIDDALNWLGNIVFVIWIICNGLAIISIKYTAQYESYVILISLSSLVYIIVVIFIIGINSSVLKIDKDYINKLVNKVFK